MSIVFVPRARVDESMLEALLAKQDLFWELPVQAAPAGAQLLYTDKDWAALSWLLSRKAREEQKHNVVVFALRPSRNNGNAPADPDAWKAAKAAEASKRGFQLVDTESMPDDSLLTAIEGRGPRDSRFQIGYRARTFVPDEVAALTAALDEITEPHLRDHFDPQVMESPQVAGIRWTEEDSDVFETILIRVFERLRIFFALAAQARQYVVVVVT